MKTKTRQQLTKTIAVIEQQRAVLGDAVVEATLLALQDQLNQLDTQEAVAMQSDGQPVALVVLLNTPPHAVLLDAMTTADFSLLPPPSNHPDLLVFMRVSSEQQEAVSRAVGLVLEYINAQGSVGLIDTRLMVPGSEASLASQLVQQAREFGSGLYLSYAAYRLVRGQFQVLRTVGNNEFFRVENTKTSPRLLGRLELEAISSEMVGRDSELQRLQAIYNRTVAEEKPHCVFITGISGVGKSRLLFEFDKWLELHSESVVAFEGNAAVSERTLTYGLLREVMAHRFDITEQHTEAEARQKLVEGVQALVGDESVRRAHIIGQLIGFDFSNSPHLLGLRSDNERFLSVAYQTLLDLLRTIYRQRHQALVIRLEDLHNADTESLNLLSFLAQRANGLPLLIVAATQPALFDRMPDLLTNPAFTVIRLYSLSAEESYQFLRGIFGETVTNQALLQRIVTATGGNPFHIEEVVRLLHDEGLLVRGERHWHVHQHNAEQVHIPPTVMGVLQARMNALSTAERAVLQQAAAVGRIFWDRAVLHLQTQNTTDHVDVPTALRMLHRRSMIVPRQRSSFAGAQEYMFQQATMYRIAYSSLRQPQRRRYHLQLAQWFIGRSMQSVGENAVIIAQHYAQAGQVARAVKWYGLAARQAFDAFLPDRAASYYDRAFGLLPENYDDTRVQSQLYEGYGKVLVTQGRYTDAISAFTAVCMTAERTGDLVTQALAWNQMARLQLLIDDPHEALQYAERAAELAERAGTPGIEQHLLALVNAASINMALDDYRSGTKLAEEAVNLLPENVSADVRAEVFRVRGQAYLTQRDLSAATHDLEAARVAAANAHAPDIQARVFELHAWLLAIQGDLEGGINYLQQAMTLAEQSNVRHDIIQYTNNLGILYSFGGQHNTAIDYLTRVLAMVGQAGWWGLVGTYATLTRSYLSTGDTHAAWQCARECHRRANRHTHATDQGVSWRTLGMVAIAKGGSVTLDDTTYSAAMCFQNSIDALQAPHQIRQLAMTYTDWAAAVAATDPAAAASYRARAASVLSATDTED